MPTVLAGDHKLRLRQLVAAEPGLRALSMMSPIVISQAAEASTTN